MGRPSIQPGILREQVSLDDPQQSEFGALPPEWRNAKLGEVVDFVMGQSPPSATYNTDGVGLPFLQGKAEFGDVYPNPAKWCSAPVKVSPHGAILISVRAPVGDVNIAPYECCLGRGLAAIKTRSGIDVEYLFYRLGYSKADLEQRSSGSTFKSINKGVLHNFPIVLPPLPEQRAIAHVLGGVQQAKASTEKVIAAARELKRSMMAHLFTYGPVPVDEADQVPLKESEAGVVPEHWELERLSDLADIVRGQVDPKTYPYSDMPHVGPENIESGTGRILSTSTPPRARPDKR